MQKQAQNRKIESLLTALLLLVLLAYLAVYTVADFRGFPDLATSDMYEDTLAARLMWEGKTLFPGNFLFGNQFYVIATPALSALFYGLTDSMNTAMALATACMSLLLLWSLDWMLRPFVKSGVTRAAALLAAVGLFFGPSEIRREDGVQLFYVMCSFYACYAITNFVVLGDYARARLEDRPRYPALAAALALCFCAGVQSLRQTCMTVLPVVCLEMLRLLRRGLKKEPLLPREARRPLIRAAAYAAANFLGVLTARFVPAKQHTIYYGQSLLEGAPLREKLHEIHTAFSVVSGFDSVRTGSARGFFLLMFLFCWGLVLAAAWLVILRYRRKDEADAACYWRLSLIACVGVLGAFLFTRVSLRAIYLFPLYFLPALSLVLIARHISSRRFYLLAALLLCLTSANLYFSYHEDIAVLSRTEPSSREQICQYAMDNGYELVYGSQSHTAPQIALFSDGALIAGGYPF